MAHDGLIATRIDQKHNGKDTECSMPDAKRAWSRDRYVIYTSNIGFSRLPILGSEREQGHSSRSTEAVRA